MAAQRRRRFGVSLPGELADMLDVLAERLGSTRSTLVEQAVKMMLEEHSHYLDEHSCSGVIVVAGGDRRALHGVLERYRDIVVSSSHHHLGGLCVELVLVSGRSSRIAALHRDLTGLGCQPRFIPLHGPAADGEGNDGGAGAGAGAEA